MKRMMAMSVALVLGGVVLAQEGAGKGREGEGGKTPAKAAALNFAQIDANGDGQVTKVEWLAFFAMLDTNKDGLISADESAGNAGKAREGDGAGKKGGEGDRKNGKGEGK